MYIYTCNFVRTLLPRLYLGQKPYGRIPCLLMSLNRRLCTVDKKSIHHMHSATHDRLQLSKLHKYRPLSLLHVFQSEWWRD